MKDNHKIENYRTQRGNAFIYVLIAVALFAALSMILARQSDTGEAQTISDEMAELYATQILDYATQAASSLEQMTFSGSAYNDIIFTLPNGLNFNTPPNVHKIYHPEGGGLTPAVLPAQAIETVTNDPPPGWYMGRFNNTEWTQSTGQDITLVAYQLSFKVCQKINEKLTGTSDIQILDNELRNFFIDDALHGGTNQDFNKSNCNNVCGDRTAYCVLDPSNDGYAFYSIIGPQ